MCSSVRHLPFQASRHRSFFCEDSPRGATQDCPVAWLVTLVLKIESNLERGRKGWDPSMRDFNSLGSKVFCSRGPVYSGVRFVNARFAYQKFASTWV